MLRTYFHILLIGLAFNKAKGQSTYQSQEYNTQLELRHDNDFLLITDRYYSSGLFLKFRTRLKKGITKTMNEQLEFAISQEVYTPAQTDSFDSMEFDRSYAGFSGLNSTWSASNESQLFNVGILFGIAGPNSGAGGFQRWYHDNLVVSDPPNWIDELKDSFHINLYASFVKEWELSPNPFGIWIALRPNGAFGSRDMFLEPEAIVYLGRKQKISNSIAFDQIKSNEREVYFSFRAAFRQVFYNGLIEGNLFGDDSLILRTPESSLLRIGFDFHNRHDRHNYKLGVRYNSSETTISRSHKFLILSYAYTLN